MSILYNKSIPFYFVGIYTSQYLYFCGQKNIFYALRKVCALTNVDVEM